MIPARITNEKKFSNNIANITLQNFIQLIQSNKINKTKIEVIQEYNNKQHKLLLENKCIDSITLTCYKYYSFNVTNKTIANQNGISIISNTVGLQYLIPFSVLYHYLTEKPNIHIFDCIGCDNGQIMLKMKALGKPTIFTECSSAYITVTTHYKHKQIQHAFQLQKTNRSLYDMVTGR